ncbi:putative dienelactone hydrolase [Stackebrandtia albiflava]|uniref:Putative dienelactone hydrolase n=1 Tax=Stackebrandtia albiflava TaxID=406432 RepID=A0A562VE10_9ACTN|nr:alpha/beta hydrolase [Stackebrandtia albiflava]TWJ16098.1 putative dienelactone hydrolase [Stackebrandtia albiflava]
MIRKEVVQLSDPSRTRWDGPGARPVRVHLWRPARPLPDAPVVLVSHGTGGAAEQMTWLAETLSRAGFLAVSVDHHGNNYVDGYRAGGFAAFWDRPRDFTVVMDHLAETGPVGRIGAAGFSIGGYTAAALVGARGDRDRFAVMLSGTVPVPPTPELPDLVAAVDAEVPESVRARWPTSAEGDQSDARVSAAFLVAPAIGPLLDPRSLTEIDRPVAVRWGGADDVTPAGENAELYANLIPGADGRQVGEEVGHYWFLHTEPVGAAVRAEVAADAVAFFTTHLT